MMNRLYYFTVEDESILAEAFAQLEKDVYAITYKVAGTEDVFVTTSETKDAMDRHDIPYNLLAEEDGSRISVEFTIVPFRDASGAMAGIAATMRDVTARFEEIRGLRREVAALAKAPPPA